MFEQRRSRNKQKHIFLGSDQIPEFELKAN